MTTVNAKAIGLKGDFELQYQNQTFFSHVDVRPKDNGHVLVLKINQGENGFVCDFRVRVLTAAQPYKNREGVVIPFSRKCDKFSKIKIINFNWQPIIRFKFVNGEIYSTIEIKGLTKAQKLRNFKILSDSKE